MGTNIKTLVLFIYLFARKDREKEIPLLLGERPQRQPSEDTRIIFL